jgi:hypothetical protein
MSDERITRREALKKAVYVTPVILTMAAKFSFASSGSGATSPRNNKFNGDNTDLSLRTGYDKAPFGKKDKD